MPISIGPCRFSGLPCRGVHDFGFLPYPTLSGAHTHREQALEWARHEIAGGLGIGGTGLLTVRTLDLDHARDPLKQLVERFADPDAAASLEFVLEDLALPVSAWLTPVPISTRSRRMRATPTVWVPEWVRSTAAMAHRGSSSTTRSWELRTNC